MKSKIDMTITLELTKKEAHWLKGLVQNPIGDRETENPDHTKMRLLFFTALEDKSI